MTRTAPSRLRSCLPAALATVATVVVGLAPAAAPVQAAPVPLRAVQAAPVPLRAVRAAPDHPRAAQQATGPGHRSATAVRTAAAAAPATPLRVTIERLVPGTMPRRGPLTITGRIVNRSSRTWSGLNAYLLTSETPLRTRAQLADAAGSDADAEVGVRRAADGLFARVGDLAPGGSVHYRLSVPRADLGISGEPGVYWVGVHVLGADQDGRDLTADGRARTFVPLLPSPVSAAGRQDRTRVALVVPLKKPVQRGSAGRLVDTGSWADTLSPDGRLDRLLSLTGRARRPFTWVVDPALLDAVRSLSRGNPSADPAPGAGADPSDGPSSSPSAGSSDDPTPTAAGGASPTAGDDAAAPVVAGRARAWLAEFRRQAATPSRTVAALPYGDLDVAAALDDGMAPIYRQGVSLSRAAMAGLGLDDVLPVVDPASGVLPPTALTQLDPGTPVILDRAALPRAGSPVVRSDGAATVVLTDPDAGNGGPKPNSQYAALEVRQRLLSEAALHALSPDRDAPLVVSMPEYWNPGDAWDSSRFFAGLDTSWLRLVDLPSVIASSPPPAAGVDAEELVYPASDRADRVPLSNLLGTRELTATAAVLGRLLTADDPVEDLLREVAMLASSTSTRADPEVARRLVAGSTAHVRAQMSQVRVEGPQFVMMSGESGPIQVTLVNGLRQSVTVGLAFDTPGSTLRIAAVDPVTLEPGRRTSIRLQARSSDIGVHSVTLSTTDSTGVPLGSSTQFSIRTSNVSRVIWVIMAVGGTLLFLAIVVRLFHRVRRRKATHGPRLRREGRA